MVGTRLAIVTLILLAFVLPASGKTYKNTYPVACADVWAAVKDVLSNVDNYVVVENDDTQMTAAYNVKHEVHVNVTGAILQRTNKVMLLPQGTSCEMHVVSNFSGWEHNDKGDFRTRVDESLAKLKTAKPDAPAK